MNNLSQTLMRVRDELGPVIPETEMILPGGERPATAQYIHVHLPIMHAAAEGYGFEDSAFGPEGEALSHMAPADRYRWIAECHMATGKGARAIAPHLSRSTYEFLQSDPYLPDGPFQQALSNLPEARQTASRADDRLQYGVVMEKDGNHYFVPMIAATRGEIGNARRLVGMGAGLYGATGLDDAFIGDKQRGIAGNWTVRSLTQSRGGPAMLVANDIQFPAPERESMLARNAVERFHLLHEKEASEPEVFLPVSPTFMPMDQAAAMHSRLGIEI